MEKSQNKRPLDWQRDIEKYRPNSYVCESCPDWDDINGCWRGFDDWRRCDFDEDEQWGIDDELEGWT